MTWIGHDVVYLLALMFGSCVGISIDRSVRYAAARRQSRTFSAQASERLREGDTASVIQLAQQTGKSHTGRVVSSGIADFRAALHLNADAEIIGAAAFGLKRSMNQTHIELQRGLARLATIGATAPLVGLFGTIVGLMAAFKGCAGQRAACMAATIGGICDALVSTALGLIVAVPAVWLYNYFSNSMEGFDIEMENSALELVSYLTIRLRLGRDR